MQPRGYRAASGRQYNDSIMKEPEETWAGEVLPAKAHFKKVILFFWLLTWPFQGQQRVTRALTESEGILLKSGEEPAASPSSTGMCFSYS